MSLEKILNEKISSLEKEIEFRNTDEWQDQDRENSFDNNGYFWNYCGEENFYMGKLEALKNLKEEAAL